MIVEQATKQALIIAVQSGKQIPQIPEIDSKVKDNISIEEMYELTEGKVEYGKANSIVKNMFYLSKSRQNAIALSNVLEEILEENSGFEDIIQYIRENGFRVEPEIISRKSGKGVKLSESVNLNLQKEEQSLVDEIRKLSSEELDMVLQNGGLYNAQNIITTTFSNIRENEKIDKSRYYAEAMIAMYNWKNIGIEEFEFSDDFLHPQKAMTAARNIAPVFLILQFFIIFIVLLHIFQCLLNISSCFGIRNSIKCYSVTAVERIREPFGNIAMSCIICRKSRNNISVIHINKISNIPAANMDIGIRFIKVF